MNKNIKLMKSIITSIKTEGIFDISSLVEHTPKINQTIENKNQVYEEKIARGKAKIKTIGPIF